MTTVLRIKDWAVHFENNRTRELKRLDWVPIPVRQDGAGYCTLLNHPNGAAHLGAWLACVEVAARCDPRGTLLRDPATPYSVSILSLMTRIPLVVLEEAVPRLLEIGWLESVTLEALNGQALTTTPQEAATIPQVTATTPQDAAPSRAPALREGNGMEWNGTPTAEATTTTPKTKSCLPVLTARGIVLRDSILACQVDGWGGPWDLETVRLNAVAVVAGPAVDIRAEVENCAAWWSLHPERVRGRKGCLGTLRWWLRKAVRDLARAQALREGEVSAPGSAMAEEPEDPNDPWAIWEREEAVRREAERNTPEAKAQEKAWEDWERGEKGGAS